MVDQVELALAVIGRDVLRDVVKALQKGVENPVSARELAGSSVGTAWVLATSMPFALFEE